MRGLGERRLYEFRLMYNAYSQLSEQVLSFVLKFSKKDILRLLTAESQNAIIWRTTSAELKQQTWYQVVWIRICLCRNTTSSCRPKKEIKAFIAKSIRSAE